MLECSDLELPPIVHQSLTDTEICQCLARDAEFCGPLQCGVLERRILWIYGRIDGTDI